MRNVESGDERTTSRHSVILLTLSMYAVPLLGILMGPLLARALGPVGRGTLANLVIWNEVSTQLFRLGVPDSVSYFDQKGYDRGALWRHAVRIAVRSTPFSILAGLIVFSIVNSREQAELAYLSALLVAWSPCVDMLATVRLRLLVGSRNLGAISVFNLLQPSIATLLTVLLFLSETLTVISSAAVFVVSQCVGYVYLYYKTSTSSGDSGPASPVPSLMPFGLRTVPSSLGEVINSRLDQLLMPAVLGLSSLGIYSVAVGVSGLSTRVGFALSQSEYARVGQAGDAMLDVAAIAIRRSTIACLSVAVILALAVPVLIPLLFGDEFSLAVVPCLILLLGASLGGANVVASNIANVLGRPGVGSISQTVGLTATLILVYPGMVLWGINGAALVTSAAYGVRFVVTLGLLHRLGLRGLVPTVHDLVWVLRSLGRRLR